jgi:hypothetical protein
MLSISSMLADQVTFDRIGPLKKPDPDSTYGYKNPHLLKIVLKTAILSSDGQKLSPWLTEKLKY